MLHVALILTLAFHTSEFGHGQETDVIFRFGKPTTIESEIRPRQIAFSEDGRYLAALGGEYFGPIGIVDLSSRTMQWLGESQPPEKRVESFSAMAFAPRSALVTARGITSLLPGGQHHMDWEAAIEVWNPATNRRTQELGRYEGMVFAISSVEHCHWALERIPPMGASKGTSWEF